MPTRTDDHDAVPTASASEPEPMRVEMWPIEQLVPYARNPRNNTRAVGVVARSLQAYGQQKAIVVDAEGTVLAGHTTLKAAQQIGWTRVNVQVSTLRDLLARGYRLMDNTSAEVAEWMFDLAQQEVVDLYTEGFDVSLTGFDDQTIEGMVGTAISDPVDVTGTSGKPHFTQMAFLLHDSQAATVRAALLLAKDAGPFTEAVNNDADGNALARLCAWAMTYAATGQAQPSAPASIDTPDHRLIREA